jgi:hypothetical protein
MKLIVLDALSRTNHGWETFIYLPFPREEQQNEPLEEEEGIQPAKYIEVTKAMELVQA